MGRSDAHRIVVACRTVAEGSPVGASISVNGVCLTVVAADADALAFDLSDETLARSCLGRLEPGDPVNLERPVTLSTRLGGHLVQGHVDGVGEVSTLEGDGSGGATLTVRLPGALMRWIVEKGSVAIDGVSLTVAAVHRDAISIALIPHTLEATTLGLVAPGDPVNVEIDLIAKYVDRLMEGR
ncbi:MAG: riboflavin synthase [Actinomycetota bacterium]